MAIASISQTFSGTGATNPVPLRGKFNVSVQGFGSAGVNLERSYDNGATWNIVETYSANTDKVGEEPETGVVYRLNVTSWASGTLKCRLSQ
ncbi:MAG: hypothetical protein WCF16_02190 [Alphaproteobacteria bacterium]